MKTHKFARKPFYVDAVRISEHNMEEVAGWCNGTIEQNDDGQKFIKVEVLRAINDRQTQGFVGDWILSAGTGFKVYTPKAFDKAFEKVKYLTKEQADAAGIKPPHEPRPSYETKQPDPRKLAKKRPPKGAPMQVPLSAIVSEETAKKLQGLSTTPPELLDEGRLEAENKAAALQEDVEDAAAIVDEEIALEKAEAIVLDRVLDEEAAKDLEAQKVIEEFNQIANS